MLARTTNILTGTHSLGDPADLATVAAGDEVDEADHKAAPVAAPALRRDHSRCLHESTPKARAACRKLATVFVS